MILHDVDIDFVKNGMTRIDKALSSQVQKRKIDDEENKGFYPAS